MVSLNITKFAFIKKLIIFELNATFFNANLYKYKNLIIINRRLKLRYENVNLFKDYNIYIN